MNYVNNNYTGYLRNIKVNMPGTDNMMAAPEVLEAMAGAV